MAYQVKLEVFEGPIDLLLHLITKQRVDIYDVSLATITEEYLAAVRDMDAADLEQLTAFLVVAATLLELKSARLLPAGADAEDASNLLEERDLLLARLVDSATFRDAGASIARALEHGSAFHGRSVPLEERFAGLAPDIVVSISPAALARAAAAALAPRTAAALDVSHLAPVRASVRDAIVDIAARLRGGEADFGELCDRTHERIQVVVRFLALLELFKAGAVDLVQSERFGEIRARWTGEAAADEVVAEVEEYTLEARGRTA